MFSLIIFEIVSVMSRDGRWVNWKIDLFTMLVLLIILLPLYLFYLTAGAFLDSRKQALFLTLPAMVTFLYFFWKIGDSLPIFRCVQLLTSFVPPCCTM